MDVEPKRIDYRKFSDSLDFYEAKGYSYMEVPWIVSDEAIDVTRPPEAEAARTQLGPLVGSAEQSFIELLLRGEDITKACAITPCFRDEPAGWDDLHQPYFMKLELINTDDSDESLVEMMRDATELFSRWLPVIIEETDIGFDIVDAERGIELGSYGRREIDSGRRFLYGTGLALPRLDVVLSDATR